MKKFLSLLTIIFFININAQNSYFPSKGNWETKSPDFFKYDSKKLSIIVLKAQLKKGVQQMG